jgi:WD40 repeat protein
MISSKFSYHSDFYSIKKICHDTKNIVSEFALNANARIIVISNDESSLFCCVQDEDAYVIDMVSGKIINVLRGHKYPVLCMITGPRDEIITASEDNTIKSWNSQGFCITTYQGHSKCVNSVIFSAKTNLIYSGSDDMTIRVWDYDTGLEIKKMIGSLEGVDYLVWVQQDETFVSGSNNRILLWDAIKMELIKVIAMYPEYHMSIKFVSVSPDERYVMAIDIYNNADIWDIETSQIVSKIIPDVLKTHNFTISSNWDLFSYINGKGLLVVSKIDIPCAIIVHRGILDISCCKSQTYRIFSDGAIINFETKKIGQIYPKTDCRLVSQSTFIIDNSHISIQSEGAVTRSVANKQKIVMECNQTPFVFAAKSQEEALVWIEAINAVSYYLSIQNEDKPDKSQIISIYRFDHFQYIYQTHGTFGFRVPKSIIELIGGYLLMN